MASTTLLTASTITSTLYPKITAKFTDLAENIFRLHLTYPPSSITLIGTTKLHGTHADIVVESNDTIRLQSRNKPVLTPEQDNLDFAKWATGPRIQETALRLRNLILRRHQNVTASSLRSNPSKPTVILAGEWIGAGVQKGVALSKLSEKKYVIISICVQGVWVDMRQYADIEAQDVAIYNIAHGGFFEQTLRLSSSTVAVTKKTETGNGEGVEEGEESTRTIVKIDDADAEALNALSADVEKRCPFAFNLFGLSGRGEGIVWNPAAGQGIPNIEAFWLKTEGPGWATNPVSAIAKDTTGKMEAKEKAGLFPQAVVTEERLEQGWAYMAEMGVEKSLRNVKVFLSWLGNDCKVEEGKEAEGMGVQWHLAQAEITKRGKEWFVERLRQEC